MDHKPGTGDAESRIFAPGNSIEQCINEMSNYLISSQKKQIEILKEESAHKSKVIEWLVVTVAIVGGFAALELIYIIQYL